MKSNNYDIAIGTRTGLDLVSTEDCTSEPLYVRDSGGSVEDLNLLTGATQQTLSGATQVLAVDGQRAYATCGTGSISSIVAMDTVSAATATAIARRSDRPERGTGVIVSE